MFIVRALYLCLTGITCLRCGVSQTTYVGGDFRGVTLLSVPGKVFAWIILDRVHHHLLEHQCPEQSGFTPKRSMIDHILYTKEVNSSCYWSSSGVCTVPHTFQVFGYGHPAGLKTKPVKGRRSSLWANGHPYLVPNCVCGYPPAVGLHLIWRLVAGFALRPT